MVENDTVALQLNTGDVSDRSEKKIDDNENIEEILTPNTYQMRPTLSETFKTDEIKMLIHRTLVNRLRGKNYNHEEARTLTKEIADEVSDAVRELNMRRFKHIVQVTMGQELGSGYRYITKCRWDAECDNLASDVYTNSTLFCVCTVFGIYLY